MAQKDEVGQTPEHLKSATGHIAAECRDKTEKLLDDARERVRTFKQDTEQYVRENPTKAVFTALATGFVLGFIFRR